MRVLLIEDDMSLAESVADWLRMDGYAVDWVDRGDSADVALQTHDYDCVLLDRGLPGLTGDQVIQRLRERGQGTPVLIITARDTLSDRVEGLDLGADDYLVKPFDLEELSARMRAALRRSGAQSSSILRCGELVLDMSRHEVRYQDRPVSLTVREFTVLQTLMLRQGQILSRSQLEQALYGWGDEIESNAVEVHIHHLRKKLDGRLIRTIRHLGYRLEPL